MGVQDPATMGNLAERVILFEIQRANVWRLPLEIYDIPGVFPGGTLSVVNEHGDKFSLGVIEDKGKKQPKYVVCAGWSAFVTSNNLRFRDCGELHYNYTTDTFALKNVKRKVRH